MYVFCDNHACKGSGVHCCSQQVLCGFRYVGTANGIYCACHEHMNVLGYRYRTMYIWALVLASCCLHLSISWISINYVSWFLKHVKKQRQIRRYFFKLQAQLQYLYLHLCSYVYTNFMHILSCSCFNLPFMVSFNVQVPPTRHWLYHPARWWVSVSLLVWETLLQLWQ